MKKILFAIFAIILLPTQVNSQELTIMSYNVRNGIGMDGIRNLDRASQVIKAADADFVALQELDSVTARSGGVDVLQELASKTAMRKTYARAIAYDGGAYGVGLLYKTDPKQMDSKNVPNVSRVALPGREEARVLLVADFKKYVLFCTHFSLTSQDQTSSIKNIIELAKKYEKPLFLVGDLNLEPDSEQFKQLQCYFTLLSDPTKTTCPADEPNATIDYIWGSSNYKYDIKRSVVIDAPIQSDHRPILVTLKYKKR